jgi:hypothetical protein
MGHSAFDQAYFLKQFDEVFSSNRGSRTFDL